MVYALVAAQTAASRLLYKQCLQIDLRIREQQTVRRGPRLEKLLPRHIGLGVVDRIDRDQFALAEIPDRDAALTLALADERFVVAEAEAGDLQFDVVLVGPEPCFGS